MLVKGVQLQAFVVRAQHVRLQSTSRSLLDTAVCKLTQPVACTRQATHLKLGGELLRSVAVFVACTGRRTEHTLIRPCSRQHMVCTSACPHVPTRHNSGAYRAGYGDEAASASKRSESWHALQLLSCLRSAASRAQATANGVPYNRALGGCLGGCSLLCANLASSAAARACRHEERFPGSTQLDRTKAADAIGRAGGNADLPADARERASGAERPCDEKRAWITRAFRNTRCHNGWCSDAQLRATPVAAFCVVAAGQSTASAKP